MTEFPKGVRLAGLGDERRLYDLFMIAHGENGFGTVDPATVREAIRKCCERDGFATALIDGPERTEAALGLRPTTLWYSKQDDPANWYWIDMLFYVHPLHRRSRHAAKLFQFAKWWEEQTGQPVVLELMPRGDLGRKELLFGRFGHRIGASFAMSELGAAAISNARH
jgi:hypothetical protein